MSREKLVVIDGKSVFYRGYYAMGALTTHDGTPTGGVYGFAAIAMEIVDKLKPDKVAVAWDSKSSTAKRKAIFAEYKAGRVKPPEDFYVQIPMLKELVEALSWGWLECPEYEADDIIGTLAKNSGCEVYIISSDMDMLQVVDEHVKMYRIVKGFSRIEEMDVRAVEEKYGIEKRQFLDLKALKGDASDNIPGVPGIGEKGAVKLLNEYGSLEGIYANIEEIMGATQKKLVAGRESAEMSYELAKIMTDAPVKVEEIPELRPEKEKVRGVLEKLEFRTLMRKFMGDEVEMTGSSEKNAGEKMQMPADIVVAWDVKAKMHETGVVPEKFWDLGQGKFLLDPLARRDEEKGDEAREYWRQNAEFQKLTELYKVYKNFDLPLIPVLYKMEVRGMLIDRKYFAELKAEYEQKVGAIEKEVWRLAGREFNVNSPVQLSEILFDELKLPTKGIKKTAKGYSTGAKELEKLKEMHEIIPKLMEYREAAKLLSTYITPLPELADEAGRIHTTFTQNVTATGRLSSLNPNLQNIPVRTEEGKKIRTGFVAGAGKVLVSADYSQFELRLASVLAGDQKLIEDFNAGVDIHTKTAAEVFGVPMEEVTKTQRRAAKVINFGVLYGMSAKGLADATGMSVPEAKEFIDGYFELRKPIREYLDKVLEQARNEGYVETYFGRRRPTPDVKSSNFLVRMGAERAAQNMPIQGTEADLMKRAMIVVDKELPEGAELVMQVHDSLIVECDEEKAEEVAKVLKQIMEGVAPELAIRLAVEVTIGRNWGEL